MSIKPLIPPVETLIEAELLRASANFGERHHSPHEAYAVMLEEFEDLKFEVNLLEGFLIDNWHCVKENISRDVSEFNLRCIKEYSQNAACEAIQLAAMAEKALKGYETEDRP